MPTSSPTMHRRSWPRAGARWAPGSIALVALLSSCGASSSFDGRLFRDSEASFEIGELDDNWKRVDVGGDNDLAFASAVHDAVVQVNASCDPALDIPLEALTAHLLIGSTERQERSAELEPLDGREALHTHVLARFDGVPRELYLVVIKKDGCVYDFALVAPVGAQFEAARGDFLRVVDGFRTR